MSESLMDPVLVATPPAPAEDPDVAASQPAACASAADAPKERHHQEGFSKRTVALTTGYVGTGYKGNNYPNHSLYIRLCKLTLAKSNDGLCAGSSINRKLGDDATIEQVRPIHVGISLTKTTDETSRPCNLHLDYRFWRRPYTRQGLSLRRTRVPFQSSSGRVHLAQTRACIRSVRCAGV